MVFQIQLISETKFVDGNKNYYYYICGRYFICQCHIDGNNVIKNPMFVKISCINLGQKQYKYPRAPMYICPKCFEEQIGLPVSINPTLLEISYLVFKIKNQALNNTPYYCRHCNNMENYTNVCFMSSHFGCEQLYGGVGNCLRCVITNYYPVIKNYKNIGFLQAIKNIYPLSDQEIERFLIKRKYKKLMAVRSLLFDRLPNDIARIAYEYYF